MQLTYDGKGLLLRSAPDLRIVYADIMSCWLRSALHVHSPLNFFHAYVTSALKRGSYALVSDSRGIPIAYASWAWFDLAAEAKYIKGTTSLIDQDWSSGSRLWFVDWICLDLSPVILIQYLRTLVMPDEMGRALRVKPGRSTGYIKEFVGVNVPSAARRAWRQSFMDDHGLLMPDVGQASPHPS